LSLALSEIRTSGFMDAVIFEASVMIAFSSSKADFAND